MTALTLHAIDDELSDALHRHASENGKSLNQAAKELLARALGLEGADQRPDPGFMRFAGRMSASEARKLGEAVERADFSRIDPEDWK